MKECSKALARRLRDPGFTTKYFRGNGIDIGGAPDPLSLYVELFPLVESIRTWDKVDGDAQTMSAVGDECFDFVHSSHCLEHLHSPLVGLQNWFRIIRPGGYLVVTVPDEDLYEQGVFPSTFNPDHKATFTIWKQESWCASSVNVWLLIARLGMAAQIIKAELIDVGYRYNLPRFDQTLTPVAESAIEFVVRKRFPGEARAMGRLPSTSQPQADVRIHLNQYRDDKKRLRAGNETGPPFQNKGDL